MPSVLLARAYYLAAELKLADRLRQQPMTVAELVQATGVEAVALARVLRILASCGVLREDRRGVYYLGRGGRALLSDQPGSLHDWLLMTGRQEVWQGLAMARQSLKKRASAVSSSHTENRSTTISSSIPSSMRSSSAR